MLIQQGMARDGAIDIFSTLVEECIAKYGDSAIETSPAFFEYGNALLRAYLAVPPEDDDDDDNDDDDDEEEEEEEEGKGDDDDKVKKEKLREAAAAAAEARQNSTGDKHRSDPVLSSTSTIQEETKIKTSKVERKEQEACENDHNAQQIEEEDKGDKDENSNDLRLSLEMMENAYSIMDNYHQTQTNVSDMAKEDSNGQIYLHWTKDQIPRVLLGIGDCLSALQRHADAADVYARALEWRQTQLQEYQKEETLAHLQCQRRVCEATILIAEELLACPESDDVITTETKSLIVKAEERIEYARGYYDKARDSLQDTVYLLGKLASKNIDLGREKEDVCFLATMIMGVGETLAALDEQEAENQTEEPVKKKSKTSG